MHRVPDYINAEVRALIGVESAEVEATHPVEASEVRRFHHATIDDARRYWDADWAEQTRYAGLVAPPAFPVHAFRRAPADPDPLTTDAPSDFGGYGTLRPGLPPLPIPLNRLLNGGYEYQFYRYARLGERIFCCSRYKDIYQKDGRAGPMVFVVLEDTYRTASRDLLLVSINTMILR
jgi:hypothetical protein